MKYITMFRCQINTSLLFNPKILLKNFVKHFIYYITVELGHINTMGNKSNEIN